MQTGTYKIHLQPEPEGGYTVTVPALPGCVSYGATLDEAIEQAQEAIAGFLETLVDLGRSIPQEAPTLPVDALIRVELPAAS